MPAAGPLVKFAEGHALAFAERADLPKQGDLPSREGTVEGAATRALPGGAQGTLAHFTWTDSDNDTHHEVRPFTLVVTQVPESIGFMPYLGFSGSGSKLSGVAGPFEEMRKLDLGNDQGPKHTNAYAFKGASENWTAQLLPPALVDWLACSAEDFGFELANGVLCVARNGYLNEPAELETLCGDAAHVATAIREESLETQRPGAPRPTRRRIRMPPTRRWRPRWPRWRSSHPPMSPPPKASSPGSCGARRPPSSGP